MLSKVAAVATLVTTFSLAAAAQQQAACAKQTDILKHLSAKYTEAPVALGLANNGGVLEVLSSKTGTSWTIIITMPNGPTAWSPPTKTGEKFPISRVSTNKAPDDPPMMTTRRALTRALIRLFCPV